MIEFKIDTYSIDSEELKRVCTDIKKACIGVAIGYREESSGQYNNGRNVVEVAQINEYGFGHNPPRPFMHKTVDDNRGKYELILNESLSKMKEIDKDKIRELSNRMGEMVKGDIQRTIENWDINDPRPNKDGSKPLIDTGKMKDSVEWWLLTGDESN